MRSLFVLLPFSANAAVSTVCRPSRVDSHLHQSRTHRIGVLSGVRRQELTCETNRVNLCGEITKPDSVKVLPGPNAEWVKLTTENCIMDGPPLLLVHEPQSNYNGKKT